MISKSSIFIVPLIMLLFIVSPLIDSLNGYLILSGIILENHVGSPSQILRLIIFGLAVLYILENITLVGKSKLIMLIAVFFYLISVELINFINHGSFQGLLIGIVFSYKLMYILVVSTALLIGIVRGVITKDKLFKYFIILLTIIGISLIVTLLLGLGFKTYGDGSFGHKGFFGGGNALGLLLGIGAIISAKYFSLTKDFTRLLSFTVITVSCFLIGSKTALLLSFLALGYLYFLTFSLYSLIIVPFILVAIYVFFQDIVQVFLTVFDVIIYRFNINESFVTFLMSSRDQFFIEAFNHIDLNGIGVLKLFFGGGAFLSYRDSNEMVTAVDLLESDFSDLLFFYGVIGLSVYFLLFIFLFYRTRHSWLMFPLLFFFLHSLIAGHAIFSGLSSIVIIFITTLALLGGTKYDIYCNSSIQKTVT